MAFATMKYWLGLSIATEWISRQMEINWLHIWQSAAANGSCNCLVIKSQLNGERGAKVTFFHLEHAYKVTHNELENRHEKKRMEKSKLISLDSDAELEIIIFTYCYFYSNESWCSVVSLFLFFFDPIDLFRFSFYTYN